MFDETVDESYEGKTVVDRDAPIPLYHQIYLQLREKLPEHSGRIVDVVYRDLVHDPLGTVAGIYESWEIPFSDEARGNMCAYLEANPQGKRGVHDYSFEETGLDLPKERAKFEAYQAAFDVPSEV